MADGAAISQLAATRSIQGITFSNTGTTAINTIGTTNSVLTLGAGELTLNAGAGAVTFGATATGQRVTFAIGQDQTWTNNSSNALGFNANNTISTNSRVLTLNGTSGFGFASNGNRLQGAGSTIKNGTGGLFVATNTQTGDFTLNSGTLKLAGTNTYTGDTNVNGGVLAVDGTSIDDTTTLVINGGKVDVTGNETVAVLLFGATPKADGVYGSTSSSAPPANQDDSRFSGTGTVTVDSSLAPGGFIAWITGTFANGTVPSGQQGPNDDPDNDGISNLVEYALDGFDPTASNAAPGSISGLLVTYTKRTLAVSNNDVTYTIEESTDLGISDLWAPATPTTDDDSVITYTLAPPAPAGGPVFSPPPESPTFMEAQPSVF